MNVYAFAFAGPAAGALYKFASRKAALSYGNGFTLAVDPEELAKSAVSVTAMAELYNAHQLPENQIKKFTDKATAAKRLIALAEAKAEMRGEVTVEDVRPAASSPANGTAKKEKKPVAPGRGRKSEYVGKKLYPSTDCKGENPRRAGTGGHKSMSIILNNPGITFEDFLKKGGRGVDLRWDITHGWAVIE